jgi:hypothetical protein
MNKNECLPKISGQLKNYLKLEDLIFCDNVLNGDTKGWCKAKISGNSSYCQPLKDSGFWDYHNCLVDSAKTVEDCEKIDFSNEPYEINECMAYVTGDVSYCEKLPEKDKVDCIASMKKDEALCETNPVFERKWNCLIKVSKDSNICKKYHKEFCKESYGNTTKIIVT